MAPPLISCTQASKSYGAHPLFQSLSLSVHEGEKLGIIGPNGAGKSALLRLLAKLEPPDSGEVITRRDLTFAYLKQEDRLPDLGTVEQVLLASLSGSAMSSEERSLQAAKTASSFGLDLEQDLSTLSGGWRKRLALAEQLAKAPRFLILDEPTNHLDLEGIQWLEKLLSQPALSLILVSHDRTFLENITSRIVEINPSFPNGWFSAEGNYSRYLEKREEYLTALQRREESLSNRVRNELEWLRRGPKARGTKARARIDEAARMMAELAEYQHRSRRKPAAEISFNSSGRRTKRLLSLEGVSKTFGESSLFRDLSLVLTPKSRIGLLGENGSGKTTLLKILSREIEPDDGSVEYAQDLKVVRFDQGRKTLNPEKTLAQTLAPEGDSVFFQGRSLHVASYASRFLFPPGALRTQVGAFSGGEQARVLIALLMLQPADVLLLDEPTNDLDIDTLEVLEESLEEFQGAVVLVTHDRLMLDRISQVLIGLDPARGWSLHADYAQWLAERRSKKTRSAPERSKTAEALSSVRKLSYLEKRELEQIEARLESAEAEVRRLKQQIEEPAIAADAAALGETYAELKQAEQLVEEIYERWSELESLKPS